MKINYKNLSLITASHIITDSFGGILPLMIPYFVMKRGFSQVLAGSLLAVLSITQNFPQPFIGYYYDRTKKYLILL